MTNAIDETWLADEVNPVVRLHDNEPIAEFEGQDDTGDAEENYRLDMVRARLAACAPEMARMLLAREWDAGVDYEMCSACGGEKNHGGHKESCAYVALLRKAGLR